MRSHNIQVNKFRKSTFQSIQLTLKNSLVIMGTVLSGFSYCINLTKTKISTLKSQLDMSASGTQNKSRFFNWILFKEIIQHALYKGQWDTKWNSCSTTLKQKTHKTEQTLLFRKKKNFVSVPSSRVPVNLAHSDPLTTT